MKTEKMTLIQAVNSALREEMGRDESVLILGEDVGQDGGVFRATENLFKEFGPDRVMDTPLAEAGIIGTSIGLALGGFRPVAEIQFMGFIYPAVNQLLAHVARYRNRSRSRFHLPMVVRMPYGGGIHAPEHHSESYEAMLVNSPGLQVVIPSTPVDAKGLLIASIRNDDPVVFMEPKRIYRAFREDVPVEPYEIPLGKAKILKEGTDVSIITYGASTRICSEAWDALSREKISAEIIDLRTLVPLDIDAILSSIAKTGRLVIVHEAPRSCGFGAEIAALAAEKCMLDLKSPIQRVTGFDTVFPYAVMENYYLPDKAQVIGAVHQTLDF